MAAGSRGAALLLAAHGSSRRPDAAGALEAVAALLRQQGDFQSVEVAFLRQEPRLEDLDPAAATTVVVPLFAAEGLFTRDRVPAALGLSGAVTRRADGRLLLYTPPPVAHPRMPLLIQDRAEAALAQAGMSARETTLLLLAHGSARAPEVSGATAVWLAEAVAPSFAAAVPLFLEQDPRADSWPAYVTTPGVIAVPLLMGEGLHGHDDLPPLFGLGPADLATSAPVFGPHPWRGHGVLYLRSAITTEETATLVRQLAEDALIREIGTAGRGVSPGR